MMTTIPWAAIRRRTQKPTLNAAAYLGDNYVLDKAVGMFGDKVSTYMPKHSVPARVQSQFRRYNENLGDEEYLSNLKSSIMKTSALRNVMVSLVKLARIELGLEPLEDALEYSEEEVEDTASELAKDIAEDISDDTPIIAERDQKYNEGYWGKIYLETGDMDAKDKALQSLKPLIMKQVAATNVSKSISHGALYGKGVGLASNAIDTWDPSKAKLSTHVTNQLKKLYRYVNKYGPMLHTPEHRISQWSGLDAAFEAYEHEYGTGEYDKKILAASTGLPVGDIEKAIAERRKVFNDSSENTSNIPWKDRYMGLDLDILSKEFEGDKTKKKVFKAIREILEAGEEGNVKVTDIVRITGLPYRTANAATKEIVHTIKNGLSFE